MLSISIAYFQILIWTVGKHERNGTRLVHLDVITSALQDLVMFGELQNVVATPMAVGLGGCCLV